MAKFTVSVDSSSDFFKSDLEERKIYCIVMQHVQDGKEVATLYDSHEELDKFYEGIKEGALPSTVALNPYELKEYFSDILKKEPKGDIIHLTLSSGLSVTYENAVATANELNKTLKNRKIYIVDSLHAATGISFQAEKLIELRDKGVPAQTALKELKKLSDHEHAWVMVDDLKHLKRGGRIGGFKAMVGTMLDLKPIIIVAKNGKLVIENKCRGKQKAVAYLVSKLTEYGNGSDFSKNPIGVLQSSRSPLHDTLKKAILDKFPKAVLKDYRISPIIGTHLGDGTIAIVFTGAPRLDLK